jgi:putative membrane protein
MPMHWWYTDGWVGGVFRALLGLVFWVLVMVVLVLLVRWLWLQTPGTRDSAAEVLKRRYARGEITREQYQQMKRDLEES